MCCILTKYTVADQTLKFGGGHVLLGGFMAATTNSANLDIRRRRLGRLSATDRCSSLSGPRLLLLLLMLSLGQDSG